MKDALDCLQDAGFSETEKLEPLCAQAVWEYKIELTQARKYNISNIHYENILKDMRFVGAIQQFCSVEINQNSQLKQWLFLKFNFLRNRIFWRKIKKFLL